MELCPRSAEVIHKGHKPFSIFLGKKEPGEKHHLELAWINLQRWHLTRDFAFDKRGHLICRDPSGKQLGEERTHLSPLASCQRAAHGLSSQDRVE
jgi:hypothetical protein